MPFGDEHVEPMGRTLRDPDVLRFTGTPVPTPPDWITTWRTGFAADETRENFAIVQGDEFVGYAVAFGMDREAAEVELGYAVAPWARGHGVAADALRLLSDWALEQGMLRLSLLISVENPASQRVAEKAGYSFEGVLRSLHHRNGDRVDMQSWSLLPGDRA
ncbi:N-acetyltransferase [Nocardioides marmoriginsengisoli]|uniref:N-acetyltransferase n=1 Tax=Nocardioides marmoriginsengisoli TaxID=661483 RepID=A0A3N0C926_9ACTN|nr:N-acetyltransferase [Nocardioides marmoriginsengisoli]